MIWVKAGIPLALGVAVILMFEGGSTPTIRLVFGTLCFVAGFGIAWVNARER